MDLVTSQTRSVNKRPKVLRAMTDFFLSYKTELGNNHSQDSSPLPVIHSTITQYESLRKMLQRHVFLLVSRVVVLKNVYCNTGVAHEGIPTGKTHCTGSGIEARISKRFVLTGRIEVINGINCYVATPSCDYDQSKVLLYLTDIFGWSFVNHRVCVGDHACI
jgi:hypothetical protein